MSAHTNIPPFALFSNLAAGGLYVVEDLRIPRAPLEKQGSVKTAALFQGYLENGFFDHPDADAAAGLKESRADISGCLVFPVWFKKCRWDQLLVVHER